MSQIPALDNSPLNLRSLREQSQRELINILKNVRGKKCLVIDPKLSGSLSLIIETSIIKEHGVQLQYLSSDVTENDCPKVIFLVRSQFYLMRLLCSQIHQDVSKGMLKEYFVYFVPRREVACEKVFEEENVHHLMTIGEYPLYLVPMDEDVLSFELECANKEYQVDGDIGSLWHIAKAIRKLETSFGLIPIVHAKGKASAHVAEILVHLQEEENSINSSDMELPQITTLILLDREVDLITPMCSQLTYEGLLDEFLHVRNGSVEIDGSVMGVQQDGARIRVPLNSSDKLFKEIRDLNFEVVVQFDCRFYVKKQHL